MPVCKEEPVKEVLIATNNAHKVEEIRTALNFEGWTFTTLAEAGVTSDPAEDADSFEGNARIKARAARAAARESLGRFVAVLADDSGLEVDALDGAPGVFSARYAGSDGDDAANNAKLLAELAAVPDAECTARFVCTLVFIDEDGPRHHRGFHRTRTPRQRGLRLRPAVFARRVRRHAGAGRGLPGREERHISSGKCLARAQKGPFPKR